MYLKRIFSKNDNGLLELDHIKVLRAGDAQRFSPEFVDSGVAEGWIQMASGKISLATAPPLSYKIFRRPGFYCCYCGERQDGSREAQTHVAAAHAGAMSPDPNNPSGYERLNSFDCVKEI